MTKDWCSPLPSSIRLAVQVTPNAKKSEVIGVAEDQLRIRLRAQPIEGKANEALVRFLADALELPKNAVLITHGHGSRRKIIEITAPHLTVEAVRQALLPSDSQ